jgi:Zn-finger nucleic acid-binding protein
MVMNRKIAVGGLLVVLLIFTGAVYASNARMVWLPERFAPDSLAPGESKEFSVTLQNKGPSTLVTEHLRISVSGDAAPLVSVDRRALPRKIKRGESVPITLMVKVPEDAPMSVVRGEVSLVRYEDEDKERGRENGSHKKKKSFFRNVLPIELTVSSIPLPPDPGEAGKRDLLGIDSNANGVRDDIERYIAFQFPDSEKRRAALSQYAQEEQVFLRDANDKEKTIANAHASKAQDCMYYVFGDIDVAETVRKKMVSEILNTPERSRVYAKADTFLGGQGFEGAPYGQEKTWCSFNVDVLAD